MRRETTCFATLPPFDSLASRVVRPKSGAKVGTSRSKSSSNAMRCAALCGTNCLVNWDQHRSREPRMRLSFPAPAPPPGLHPSLRPDGERVTTIIVPARTMAGIDSSELVDDEAPHYFAAGEPVAPTATKTVATGRPSIDANTLHERIGRNRRDILREV